MSVHNTEEEAWKALLPPKCRAFIFEDGFVHKKKSLKDALSLAETRGRVLAHVRANEPNRVPSAPGALLGVRLAKSTWTAAVGKAFGVESWPTNREASKNLAIALVKDKWEMELPEDECEAVLQGWAWVLSGGLVSLPTYKVAI